MLTPWADRARGVLKLAYSRGVLAFLMVVAGILHFTATDAYVGIMPDYLPWHRELVYLSGGFEILFGLGLLWRKTREAAGVCLILLYLAVLPANVTMAVNDIQPAGFHIPAFVLWARLPFPWRPVRRTICANSGLGAWILI